VIIILKGYILTFLALGVLCFVMFVIYDVNSVLWHNKILHKFFLFSCILLFLITIIQIYNALRICLLFNIYKIIYLMLSILFFMLLIYTIFFALPFNKTYIDKSEKLEVYDKGMYAICRHPGVIWFFFFYLFLGLAFNSYSIIINGIIYSICNFIYIIFQDLWTFPQTIQNYHLYKESTPFIFPTIKSLKAAINKVR